MLFLCIPEDSASGRVRVCVQVWQTLSLNKGQLLVTIMYLRIDTVCADETENI